MPALPPCPLCEAELPALHHQGAERAFWHCGQCDLVFVAASERLPYDEEIARYRHHRNDEDDADYVEFLSRLARPVIARTAVGAEGIDYGSGVSPALAQILSQSGRPTVAYDPAFRADAALLDATYDFLTCSEVIEHVHHPMTMLGEWQGLVRPSGVIGVMTGLRPVKTPFAEWWYARDPTHVCFYSETTMRWIAARFGWTVELPSPNVALFTLQLHSDRS